MLKANLKLVFVQIAYCVKNYFLACKNSHAHLQYVYNICAKFQIDCLKTLGGVITQTFIFLKVRRTDILFCISNNKRGSETGSCPGDHNAIDHRQADGTSCTIEYVMCNIETNIRTGTKYNSH